MGGKYPKSEKGNKSGDANERSITEGRVALSQGKQVNTPSRLRSSKLRSDALEKYGKEAARSLRE